MRIARSASAFIKLMLTWVLLLLFLYLVLEVTFLFWFSRLFPFSALGEAGASAALLVQHSKFGVYPKNYVAILGDSYAFGQGDWSLEAMYEVRAPYSAAHVLHQSLQKDVISFGVPASDSITANLIWPDVFIKYAEAARIKKIEDPEFILVYFYEGNDLEDNVEVAEKIIYPLLKSREDIYQESIFQERLIPAIVSGNENIRSASKISFSDRLLFYHFSKSMILDFIAGVRGNGFRRSWQPAASGNITQVRVGEKKVFLTNRIQSPAITLDNRHINLGVYIFEQSLIALQRKFPHSKLGVAYIPAVVTPYHVVSPFIHDWYANLNKMDNNLFPSSIIKTNSNFICSKVRDVADRRGIGFVDTRSRLRAVAKNKFVHGPMDWNHFNRLGYETMSEDLILLVNQLGDVSSAGLPACQWD